MKTYKTLRHEFIVDSDVDIPGTITLHSNGYARVIFKGRGGEGEYLHRWLMGCLPNDKKVVDHIDGDIYNNRRSNLKVCTQKENMHNPNNTYATNTSGTRGVSFDKDRGKWAAYIKIDYRKKSLGRFDNIDDAIAARKQAEKELL